MQPWSLSEAPRSTPALRRLPTPGACEDEKSCNGMISHAEVYWGRPWEKIEHFFRKQMLQPGLIVNSIAGLTAQVGQKESLARLHVRCLERFG